jgi:hypothetical protein
LPDLDRLADPCAGEEAIQVSDKSDPTWKPAYDKSTVRDPQ